MVSTSGHWTQSSRKRIHGRGRAADSRRILQCFEGNFMRFSLTIAAVLLAGGLAAPRADAPLALPKQAPTVDQILSLERAGSPELSPDGNLVAYTVRTTNWDDNAY